MPRPRKTLPTYLHNKASNRAFCIIREADGSRRTVWLGTYDSPESRLAYSRIVAGEVPEPTRRAARDPEVPGGLAPGVSAPTVTLLFDRFLVHAETHYRRLDGTPTKEVDEYRMAFRPVLHLFGALPVTEFGPKCLKAARSLMVEGYSHREKGEQPPLSRGVINQRVGRVVHVFKWGVGEELVPAPVWQALKAVPGLQANRTQARETEPVLPVEWEAVAATLPRLNPIVRAMVLFQWHTGCRPGEACSIKASEIDRSGDVWFYKPTSHKLSYRGKLRVIAIGPQAQEVLRPFLDRTGFLFSPVHAVELINAEKRAHRKSKVQPSQVNRKKTNPKRTPGESYLVMQLAQAVRRACVAAKITPWHPNQLRHAFATRVRAAIGLEAAQVALGHTNANITQVYAERNQNLAAVVAKSIG